MSNDSIGIDNVLEVDIDVVSEVDKLRHAFTCLRVLHGSANKRIIELERKVASDIIKIHALEMQKHQWESEKYKQLMMISERLNDVNAKNNEYLEENRRLQEIISKHKMNG